MKQIITTLIISLPIFLFAQTDSDSTIFRVYEGVRYKVFKTPILIAHADTSYILKGDTVFCAIKLEDIEEPEVAEKAEINDTIKTAWFKSLPKYKGGESEMMRFIREHFVIPAAEKEVGVQGRMLVGFTINEDGSVSDMYIRQGLTYALNAEAMRIVGLLKFKPGILNGKPVKVNYTIPIKVRYNDSPPVVTAGLLIASPRPFYIGGEDEVMAEHIKGGFKMPWNESHTGQMTILFEVNENGEVVNPIIPQNRGICKDLDAEALRVIQLLRFIPAKEKGKTVVSRCMLHINVL